MVDILVVISFSPAQINKRLRDFPHSSFRHFQKLSITSQLYEVFWSAGFPRGAKILRQPTKFLRNRAGNQAEENLGGVEAGYE